MTKTVHKPIGLALGGGGVKGLAHIALLKKLDDLNIKPVHIAGTSMGAILGALYAAGLSGLEIEERVRSHIISSKDGFKKAYAKRKQLVKWVKVFALEKSRGGLFTAEGLFEHLFTEILDLDFSDLKIPFSAIACDFHSGQEVVLSSGSVLNCVRASMAVPGVFAPVEINGKLLVDGGVINNVPCDRVTQEGRQVIASDVISLSQNQNPSSTQVMSGAMAIMLRAATGNKFSIAPPDFIFQPNTSEIDVFNFHKIRHILELGDKAIQEAAPKLEALIVR